MIATRLPILDDTIMSAPPVKNEDGDITITSSYAIFYKDGESETPASVVGFQYSYLNFFDRFIKLTKGSNVSISKMLRVLSKIIIHEALATSSPARLIEKHK